MVEIRVKRGWSYSAYSYFRHGLRPRSWQAFYFPATKDTPDAIALGLQLMSDLKQNGITEEDYDFAQASLVNSAGFMFNTPQKRVENILLERTLELPDGFMKSYGSALSRVSRAEVNAALKKFIKPETFSILVLGTAKDLKAKVSKATGVAENKISVVPFNRDE
jgi:zinc protease